MTLKRFIQETADPRIFRPTALPKRSGMAAIAEKIAKRRDAVRTLSSFESDALLEKLRNIARTGVWSEISAVTRIRRYVSGTGTVLSGFVEAQENGAADELLPIDQVPNLRFTPGRLACGFCGISERCSAAIAAGTAKDQTRGRGTSESTGAG